MTVPESLAEYLSARKGAVDAALEQFLPASATPPAVIHEAMRYAVMAGGKRIRPILAIAAAEACGAESQPLIRQFGALELIHTYSLVHDDLPALDNDDLRRGRPTSHVVFGEAMAILAGDALLTEAFSWLAEPVDGVDAARQLRAVGMVASAVDSRGMIGGQVADLEAERKHLDPAQTESLLEQLEFIHTNKTGRLITASVLLGGLLAGASALQLEALETYGRSIGLAFQIVDDLLDVEGSSESLGKTAGKDVAQGKLTYPALAGADQARIRLAGLLTAAEESADMIGGPVNYLGPMARYICERKH
jgi:geranylgeranyl diphosphate synthase type II